MKTRKRLGEILVDAGLLTEDQLDRYIKEQRKSDLKLGEYLIQEGVVSEEVIVDLISAQISIDKYSPMKHPVDLALARVITEEDARKLKALPLARKSNWIVIAMLDPLDIMTFDAVESLTNMEVDPVICTQKDFANIFGMLYGSSPENQMKDFETLEDMVFAEDEEEEQNPFFEEMEMKSLQDMAEEAPVIRMVNALVSQAIREGASDVHISPEKTYVQTRFRVDGKLHEVPSPPRSMFPSMVSRLKILANLDIALTRIPQDGRFTVKIHNKEVNIRVSSIPTIHGENVVLRLLDTSSGILTMQELGMSPEDQRKVESMVDKPYGMILSTGPTGSGKSTSLFSMMGRINKPDINIITLEDPVEYRMEKIRQVQLNKKAGMTFAGGLRSILRQDPDVIMVGEIRDSETAKVSVQAALTGHRVLSTVHTNDAAGAITRFIDMGIEPFLVSSVMLVSIAQRLIRKICPECAEAVKPSREALAFWGLDNVQGANFMKGKGCPACMNTGYKGRTGVYEVLVIDEMVQDMILKQCSPQEITRKAVLEGTLKTLKDDAAAKVLQGITTLEEAALGVMV